MSYVTSTWLEHRLRQRLARPEYELRRFQQKYNPNQPRVPAGNPYGGQWTSGGGDAARDQDGRNDPLVVRT